VTAASIVDEHLRNLFFRYDRTAKLDPEESIVSEEAGVRTTHFVISSTHGQRVPGLIWSPAGADRPLPTVLLQHGAGSRKEDAYISLTARRWARQGMTCVAIDANDHGERQRGERDPSAIWTRPWTRRDHAVQMCVDLQRTVDYLETKAEADTTRLGFVGFSMGTINGVSFVALDRRVKAAAFAIGGGNLFELRPKPDDPMVRSELEIASQIVDPIYFAGKIAPRPVLMVNGLRDETVTPAAAEALYAALAEPKRIVWYDGGHTEIGGRELKEIWAFLQENL
jgi:dienelactone hydrolase